MFEKPCTVCCFFPINIFIISDKTSTVEVVLASYFVGLDMDFGKPLRKRKCQIKYEAFYCSEIILRG